MSLLRESFQDRGRRLVPVSVPRLNFKYGKGKAGERTTKYAATEYETCRTVQRRIVLHDTYELRTDQMPDVSLCEKRKHVTAVV